VKRYEQHTGSIGQGEATDLGRLLVLFVPIVAVLYPIMRWLPATYGWLMQSRIARLYGELRLMEHEIPAEGSAASSQLVERLRHLEKRANQLKMPIAYESMIYLLRNHIAVVSHRMQARQPGS
jgi:hypothetical protein